MIFVINSNIKVKHFNSKSRSILRDLYSKILFLSTYINRKYRNQMERYVHKTLQFQTSFTLSLLSPGASERRGGMGEWRSKEGGARLRRKQLGCAHARQLPASGLIGVSLFRSMYSCYNWHRCNNEIRLLSVYVIRVFHTLSCYVVSWYLPFVLR